jgi:hypothetical protein
MSKGLAGVDSSSPVTQSLIDQVHQHFQAPAAYWGRYFGGVTSNDPAEYRQVLESALLAKAKIPILCIGQNTLKVGGSRSDGFRDGTDQLEDILASFDPTKLAQQKEVLVFLDVEPRPAMSADYYLGWSQAVQEDRANGIKFLACLYSNWASNSTWTSLVSACKNGASCHGVWVAAWHGSGACPQRKDFDVAFLSPEVADFNFPILLWQYSNDCGGSAGSVDLNQLNPALDNKWLLDRLVHL